MKVTNITDEIVTVLNLPIAPGRTAYIPDNHWQVWMKTPANAALAATLECERDDGREIVIETVSPPTEDDRIARAVQAIAELKEEPNAADWTQSGAPKLNVLQQVSGLADLTTAERNAAWEKYQSENE